MTGNVHHMLSAFQDAMLKMLLGCSGRCWFWMAIRDPFVLPGHHLGHVSADVISFLA